MDLVVLSMYRSTVMFLPALPPRNGVAIVPRGPSWNYPGVEGAAHPYSMVAALKEYFSPIGGLFFHRIMYRTGKHATEPMGLQNFSETAAEGQEKYLGASQPVLDASLWARDLSIEELGESNPAVLEGTSLLGRADLLSQPWDCMGWDSRGCGGSRGTYR